MEMAEKHHPDWNQSVRRWTAPVLLAAVVIGFYWKLVLTNQFTWLANNDLSSMVLPWFQFQATEFHAGRFPLWDPYSWGGQPLLAQAQPGSAYPLNWLLFLVPLKHTWLRQAALHWYYVAVRILAALCFYWLCRGLGRSRHASLVGGFVYGVGGYLGSVEWPQMVNGAVWVPLVFLFQFRAAQGDRPRASAVFSGFFLGLTWLCGHHQLPLFASLGSVFLWLFFIFRSRWPPNMCVLRLTAVSFGIAVLVSGLQTVPTAEYGRLAQRWTGADHALRWNETVPYAVHEDFSFKPLSVLSVVIPGLDVNEDPLIGAVAFTLAMIGLGLAWKEPRVRWLAALGMGALLFALGPNSIFHGFLYSVTPLIEKARVPAHGMILFHLAVCGLAAFGVDLFPTLPRRAALITVFALTALGVLLSIAGFLFFEMKVAAVQGDTRFMVTALSAFVGAAVLWAGWRGTLGCGMATAALLGLIALELGNTSGFFFANYERDKDRVANLRRMAVDTDIESFLRRQPGSPFRVEYDQDVIPHNLGDWWGVEAFTAYTASAPDIVMRNNAYHPRVQALLGVRYFIGSKPSRPDQLEAFTGASGRKVFRNPEAFPRAWAVHQVQLVKVADTNRAVIDPALDLRSQAIVTRPLPRLETCSGDGVAVTSHRPNRVALDAELQCRGLVILSETYFPGWRASVDGRPAEIYDVDGMARGVVVEGGKHSIVMSYRPWSVVAGGLMTLLGAGIAAAVLIVRIRGAG